MTITITAMENTRAKLIAKTLRTSCKDTADMVAIMWEKAGFVVKTEIEE